MVIVGETDGTACVDPRAANEAAAVAAVTSLSRVAAAQDEAYRAAQATSTGRHGITNTMSAARTGGFSPESEMAFPSAMMMRYGITPPLGDGSSLSWTAISKQQYLDVQAKRAYVGIANCGYPEVPPNLQLESGLYNTIVLSRNMLGVPAGSDEALRLGNGLTAVEVIPSLQCGQGHPPKQHVGGRGSDDVDRLLDGLTERASKKLLNFTSAKGVLDAFTRIVMALLAAFLAVREMDIKAFPVRGVTLDYVTRPSLFLAPDGGGSFNPLYFSYHALVGEDMLLTLLRDAVSDHLFDGEQGVKDLEHLLDSLLKRIFSGMAEYKTLTVIFLNLAESVRPRLEGRAGALASTFKSAPAEAPSSGGNGRNPKRRRDSAGSGAGQGRQPGSNGKTGPKWDGSYDREEGKYRTPSGYARIAGGEPKAPQCKTHTQASQAGSVCCYSHAHLKKTSFKVR